MHSRYVYEDGDRAECLPLIPPEAQRILDVGCAYGGFGQSLKNWRPNTEVWGIEPHPDAAALARGRLDRVIEGSFPDALRGETFDAITFLDVLEHLVDPWTALERSRAMLDDSGVVVASIPNIRNYTVTWPLVMKGRWDYADEGILDRTHLRFFTKATIRELFVETGFTIEHMVPLFSSTPPPARSRTGLAIRLLSEAAREELLTIRYGVVARPT